MEPDAIRRWPFVSANYPPAQIAEMNELARRLGWSRARLLREMADMGLPYIRKLAEQRDDAAVAAGEGR